MNFSICLIARNEAKTLPKLVASLSEFREKGGEILLLDTGSTDSTVQVAKKLGCEVHEVGTKFLIEIDQELADKINAQFVVDGEEPLVKAGDKQFDYSSARNYIAYLAPTDFIFTPDCDEVYTKFDIEAIEKLIKDGVEQLEYNFVFSHDEFGNEAIKFLHCKAYDRRKLRWQGIIHEVLAPTMPQVHVMYEPKRQMVGEDIIKLEHWQNPETDRSHYLRGLAIDCFTHPESDRNSHYLGRELLWCGRPQSAIKELERHIAMDKWPAERAQSMIYIGDAYGALNNPAEQAAWYHKAFYFDSTRREALIKLARFYQHNNNPQAAMCFAAAALEIPWTPFYGNDMAHYTHEPHEILYWAKGWLGDVMGAKLHLNIALSYQPLNSNYLRDIRFYTDLPKISFIIPQLGRPEGLNRCIESINNLNYPQDKIEILVEEGDETVPVKVDKAFKKSTGDLIVYAANDTEFTPDSLIIALMHRNRTQKGLVAFNTGEVTPDQGNICEHFLISRPLVEELGGIFDTRFHHVGVDNLLWAKADKLGQATRCDDAVVLHQHFSRGGQMDDIYEKGWSKVDEDRQLLKLELAKI